MKILEFYAKLIGVLISSFVVLGGVWKIAIKYNETSKKIERNSFSENQISKKYDSLIVYFKGVVDSVELLKYEVRKSIIGQKEVNEGFKNHLLVSGKFDELYIMSKNIIRRNEIVDSLFISRFRINVKKVE